MKDGNFFRGAALLAAALGVMSGCGGVQSRVHGGTVDKVLDQRPDRGSFLEAVGMGAADPAATSDTQKKAEARDAAIVKAQYEMLSMVKGVRLSGGVTVAQSLEKDSKLSAEVRDMIRGAEIWKSEFTADNGCVVTLRLPKDRLEKLMGVKFE